MSTRTKGLLGSLIIFGPDIIFLYCLIIAHYMFNSEMSTFKVNLEHMKYAFFQLVIMVNDFIKLKFFYLLNCDSSPDILDFISLMAFIFIHQFSHHINERPGLKPKKMQMTVLQEIQQPVLLHIPIEQPLLLCFRQNRLLTEVVILEITD